jgi:hypothetical protein
MKISRFWPAKLGITLALLANVHGRQANDLWQVYQVALRNAKYVDLTHTITPAIPVWKGFDPSKFAAAVKPRKRRTIYL